MISIPFTSKTNRCELLTNTTVVMPVNYAGLRPGDVVVIHGQPRGVVLYTFTDEDNVPCVAYAPFASFPHVYGDVSRLLQVDFA